MSCETVKMKAFSMIRFELSVIMTGQIEKLISQTGSLARNNLVSEPCPDETRDVRRPLVKFRLW
jgi:hypothetical protein